MAWINQAIYATIFAMAFFAFNYLSKGFLASLIKVKVSNKDKVLLLTRGRTKWAFTDGVLDDDHLRYEDEEGDRRSVIIQDGDCVQRMCKESFVMTDKVTNSVMKPNLDAIKGYNAKRVDNIITRAATAPNKADNRKIIAILLGVGLILIAVGYIAVKQIPALQAQVAEIGSNLIQ